MEKQKRMTIEIGHDCLSVFEPYFAIASERFGCTKKAFLSKLIIAAIKADVMGLNATQPPPAPAPAARPAMQGSPLPAPPKWVTDAEKWEVWILDFENENYAAERNGQPPRWALTANPYDGTKH